MIPAITLFIRSVLSTIINPVWLLIPLFIVLLPGLLTAQETSIDPASEARTSMGLEPLPEPYIDVRVTRYRARRLLVLPPYAGKFEARISGSTDPGAGRLRLDIGASTHIFQDWFKFLKEEKVGVGAEFFTWSRLRDAGGFKFPVETVDYYLGITGALSRYNDKSPDIRLRIGHISAHLVDGDTSFGSPGAEPMTYSREFVDILVGGDAAEIGSAILGTDAFQTPLYLRPYVGSLILFHTIPDTLGSFTPYAGFDLTWSLTYDLHARAGYELRVNTELETLVEHSLGIGLKFAESFDPGLLLEGRYYYGRSPFGQHFNEIEETISIGFAVEF